MNNKKNYLEGTRAYLSGAIQYSTDLNWRTEPKRILTQEFGLNLFDPSVDEKQNLTDVLYKAKEERDFETIVQIARGFVRKDLCMVDRSDLLIAFLPKGVRTCGTYQEIITSNNCKKPTLLVSDGNKAEIALWLYGYIPSEFMFDTWDDLYNYLREVNDYKHTNNNRWHYIYGL